MFSSRWNPLRRRRSVSCVQLRSSRSRSSPARLCATSLGCMPINKREKDVDRTPGRQHRRRRHHPVSGPLGADAAAVHPSQVGTAAHAAARRAAGLSASRRIRRSARRSAPRRRSAARIRRRRSAYPPSAPRPTARPSTRRDAGSGSGGGGHRRCSAARTVEEDHHVQGRRGAALLQVSAAALRGGGRALQVRLREGARRARSPDRTCRRSSRPRRRPAALRRAAGLRDATPRADGARADAAAAARLGAGAGARRSAPLAGARSARRFAQRVALARPTSWRDAPAAPRRSAAARRAAARARAADAPRRPRRSRPSRRRPPRARRAAAAAVRVAGARGEVDRDGDGRTDQWIFREAATISRELFDEDFDGRPDRTLHLRPGQPRGRSRSKRTRTTTAASTPGSRSQNGAITRRRVDEDGDGQVDTWELLPRRPARAARARHQRRRLPRPHQLLPGRPTRARGGGRRRRRPRPRRRATTTPRRRSSRVEEDADGDGKVDVVSHYDGGRLTSREILDTSLLKDGSEKL